MSVSAPPTDYERDLARISDELERLLTEPANADQMTRVANCRYRRASMTGDLAELEQAEVAVSEGRSRFGHWPDLCFLQANIDFKLHRLERVKAVLELSAALRGSPEGRALQADLDLQEGRYEEARRGYESLIEADRTWDALARLAHLELKLGDDRRADELYSEAVDELTAKEMRSFCWVELRRGEAHLSRGRYSEAERHYERAKRAYSGDWAVDEHIAELLAAQGQLDQALALYEQVVDRAPRPELQQALGDLYLRAGSPDEARPRHELALAAYLASVEQGGVHYYHHLADFYLHSQPESAAAVRWALADVALRSNFETQATLARALFEDGQIAAAETTIGDGLASGSRDPHLLATAGKIYLAVGRHEEGRRLLDEAARINPHDRDFHVHR